MDYVYIFQPRTFLHLRLTRGIKCRTQKLSNDILLYVSRFQRSKRDNCVFYWQKKPKETMAEASWKEHYIHCVHIITEDKQNSQSISVWIYYI